MCYRFIPDYPCKNLEGDWDVLHHLFSTSAKDGGERLGSRSGRFKLEDTAHGGD